MTSSVFESGGRDMTRWSVAGLSPQHLAGSFRASKPSESVELFPANDGTRPHTMYRFKSGHIQIKAGIATLRNRRLWTSFKSNQTSAGHVAAVGTLRHAKAYRPLVKSERSMHKLHDSFPRRAAGGDADAGVPNGPLNDPLPDEANALIPALIMLRFVTPAMQKVGLRKGTTQTLETRLPCKQHQ